MTNETTVNTSGGIGALGLLGVALVLLKALGYIDISWWWCTAPFWGPWLLILAIVCAPLAFAGILLAAAYAFDAWEAWRRRRSK